MATWDVVTSSAERRANALRHRFDRAAHRLTPAVLVALLGAAAGIAGSLVTRVFRDCGGPPVSLARLEVTYYPSRFRALLLAEEGCRGAVVWSFAWDMLFAPAYALFLAALYVWAERWRRWDPGRPAPGDDPSTPDHQVTAARAHLFVLAPLAAGLLDALVENAALGPAAALVDALPRPALAALVLVGSIGATLKWVLLLLFAYGLGAELLSGPRGLVVRRLRFSVLAVALGALPLLVVPQGEDILQRLVEGEHPWWRIVSGVVAIAFGAHAVWYCGRKLLQLGLRDAGARAARVEEAAASPWFAEFATHGPRVLGVAGLALGGAALARAGLGSPAFLTGAGVGLLVVSLLDAARRRAESRGQSAREPDARESGSRAPTDGWLGVPDLRRRVGQLALGAGIAAATMVAWWLLASPVPDDAPDYRHEQMRNLWVGAWLCLVVAWAFALFVYFRRAVAAARAARSASVEKRAEWSPERAYEGVDPYALPPGLKLGVWAAVAVSVALLALITARAVPVGRALGPLWVITLAVVNAVFYGSLAVWVNLRWRVPVVRLGLAAAALFSLWNENHVVRPLPTADTRPDVAAHFRQWLEARRAAGVADDMPVVLVAAQGGGLRAAYWTALVLATAQDRDSTFARRVYAISGISGGSLGAALFAAIVRDARAAGGVAALPCARDSVPRPPAPRTEYATCVRRFMRDDHLSPVLAKLVAPDVTQRFLPVAVAAFDRSTAIEGSWARSYETATGAASFDSAFRSLDAPLVPMLVLNTTQVESGRRYVTAPVRLDSVLHDAGDVLRELGADLSVTSAVHNSARFPYVSPAGRLDDPQGREHGRVVDGGYFEVSGLATARELIRLARLDTTGAPAREVVVLYLCNDPLGCDRDVHPDTTGLTPGSAANDLLAPPRAVLHARDARGSLARAELADSLHSAATLVHVDVCKDLPLRPGQDSAAAARAASPAARSARDRAVSPPLGWVLSQLARDWMDSSLVSDGGGPLDCRNHNRAVLDSLQVWLTRALAGGAQRLAGAPSSGTNDPASIRPARTR